MAKSAVIGNLRVNMGLDSAQFQAGVARVGKSMDSMAKKAAVFGAAVGAAMTAAAGAMAVAVGNVINKADQLGDVADRMGVSIEALQELRHAADRGGMAVGNFDMALRRFVRRASEAALGTGAAKDAFKDLGISLLDNEGRMKSSERLLSEVADAMQKVQNPADRLRLAFKMFDTDGAAMVNVLAGGAAGLAHFRQEARDLGIVLSEESVRGAQAFKDNIDTLTKAKDGLVMKLTAHLLPALENLSEQFLNFVNDASKVQAAADSIGKSFDWVTHSAMRITAGIQGMRAEIASFAEVGQKLLELDFLGARDAWNAGQSEAAQIIADMEKKIAGGVFSGASQGSIQRRISAAFGESGRASAESFTQQFEAATKAGRGRIKAAIDPMIAEAARIFEATRTPLERYQAQIARLNELLAAGAINQDTYNRAVAQAQDAFQKAEEAGNKARQTMEQIGQSIAWTFSSAFQGLIDGSKKVKDVLKDLLSQLSSMLMNSAFQALFSGGSAGGGILGSLFGGFKIPGFATGTNYAPGGLAWVGERGPELVNLPRGSQVIPNHMLGAGGGGVNVPIEINIDATGADASGLARVEQQLGKLKAEIPSMVISNVRKAQQSNVKLG